MNAVKFMKLDFMKIKSQIKLMMAVAAFVVIFAFKTLTEDMLVWGVMYMIFMGIILTSIPFSIDVSATQGFISLLPARARSRVYGRFLYGFVFLCSCTLIGCILIAPLVFEKNVDRKALVIEIITFFALGLIITSLQFLMSYFFEIKNAQILSIMRMIPAFVFFWGTSLVMDKLSESQESMNDFSKIVSKVMEHQEIAIIGFLGVAILITLLCMWSCAKREESKEM